MQPRGQTRASVYKALVGVRLEDARTLWKTGQNARLNGAVYLGGYAVECALKARICADQKENFLDPKFRTHDLVKLLEATKRHNAMRKSVKVRKDFLTINSNWGVELRYDASVMNQQEVGRFLGVCGEFVKWLSGE